MKISKFQKGRPKSEETKKKMRKPKDKIVYPHCNKYGGVNAMKRYHFDNCKRNPDYNIEDHLITCPWCNLKSIFDKNMTHYHFNNCKHKPK